MISAEIKESRGASVQNNLICIKTLNAILNAWKRQIFVPVKIDTKVRFLTAPGKKQICPSVDNDEVIPNKNCERISIAALSDKIDIRVRFVTAPGKKQSLNTDERLVECAALLDPRASS